MKKSSIPILLILLLFLSVPLRAEKRIFRVEAERLNIRATPSIKGKIIGSATRGDYIFTDSEKIKKDWVPIETADGKEGYVNIHYLRDVTPEGFSDTVTFYVNYFVEKYLLITILILILLGIILGLTKTVVIYRDYSDVLICAALLLVPLGAIVLWSRIIIFLQSETVNDLFVWGLVISEVLLFLYIIVRTYRDNGRSLIKMFLALITKIPLAILTTLLLLALITPEEKRKRSDKTDILLILAILTPLIYGLIRHRVWIYRGDEGEELAEKLKADDAKKILKPRV